MLTIKQKLLLKKETKNIGKLIEEDDKIVCYISSSGIKKLKKERLYLFNRKYLLEKYGINKELYYVFENKRINFTADSLKLCFANVIFKNCVIEGNLTIEDLTNNSRVIFENNKYEDYFDTKSKLLESIIKKNIVEGNVHEFIIRNDILENSATIIHNGIKGKEIIRLKNNDHFSFNIKGDIIRLDNVFFSGNYGSRFNVSGKDVRINDVRLINKGNNDITLSGSENLSINNSYLKGNNIYLEGENIVLNDTNIKNKELYIEGLHLKLLNSNINNINTFLKCNNIYLNDSLINSKNELEVIGKINNTNNIFTKVFTYNKNKTVNTCYDEKIKKYNELIIVLKEIKNNIKKDNKTLTKIKKQA